VFDLETLAFLQSGYALIVGTVSEEGEPRAARAWGLTVLQEPPARVRLLLDARDRPTLARLPGPIAVTGADVRTLYSVQLKGRVVEVAPATDDDRARAVRFYDDFFDAIVESDGTPRWKPERLIPPDYVVALVDVDEVYDQTPGPSAGTALTPEAGSEH
jgi:hypothetical protein